MPQTGTVEWYMDRHVHRNYILHCGHGPGGLIGITLNEKAVHRWALSLHICSRLMKYVVDLKDYTSLEITTHKEKLAS